MDGTSVRFRGAAEFAGMSRDERIRVLRSRMDALGSTALNLEQDYIQVLDGVNILRLQPPLAGVLPGGGLPKRVVTLMAECPALVLEIIAQITECGGLVGVVGWPDLCFAEVIESGGDLRNIVVVPEPGLEPLSVVATLAEGLDLVVCYLPRMEVSPSRARPLLAKLRQSSAAVILIGAQLQASAVRIDATVVGFYGAAQGMGRIQALEIAVEVRVKQTLRTTTLWIGKPQAQHAQRALKAV